MNIPMNLNLTWSRETWLNEEWYIPKPWNFVPLKMIIFITPRKFDPTKISDCTVYSETIVLSTKCNDRIDIRWVREQVTLSYNRKVLSSGLLSVFLANIIA